jgi:hypothetical protein
MEAEGATAGREISSVFLFGQKAALSSACSSSGSAGGGDG